jgi:hypothetical protein
VLSATIPHQALLLPLPVPLLHRFALVVHLLAPGQRQFDLRPPSAVKIDRQGHEREALAVHRSMQLGDFATLQQQLPLASRLMVEAVAVAIFRNVAVDQPHLVILDGGVTLRYRSLALPQRFYLGSGELNPGLEPLLDEIVESRPPVLGDDLLLVELLRERLGHGA